MWGGGRSRRAGTGPALLLAQGTHIPITSILQHDEPFDPYRRLRGVVSIDDAHGFCRGLEAELNLAAAALLGKVLGPVPEVDLTVPDGLGRSERESALSPRLTLGPGRADRPDQV
jgi:hypothetical protein